MEQRVFETTDQLATAAASFVIDKLLADTDPLFCAASGDTPVSTYTKMVARYRQGMIPVEKWSMLSLDEWTGLNKDDKGSCGYTITEKLTAPINWPESNTCFFNGRAADLQEECLRIEHYLEERGPITVAILGLGLNGHIGLNEPGTDPNQRTHVSSLENITATTGQKYFNSVQSLTGGITLGIANLMEAKHLLLLVTGAHKREIVRKLQDLEIDPMIPCTLLKKHPSFYVFLDREAAGL